MSGIPAVFVVLKVGHVSNPALNVTEQPTAAWTIQQFRVQIARGEPFIVGRAGSRLSAMREEGRASTV